MTSEKLVKTCKYLDANQQAAAVCISDHLGACYPREILSTKITDYRNIDLHAFMEKRKKFIAELNAGKTNLCDGCAFLETKRECDVNFDKLSWLNIANFTTCNLRCKYCYFSEEQLGAKLEKEDRQLLPIVKNMAEQGLFTDHICLAIAGGEPLLFEDIPETLNYLSQKYKSPNFSLQSNSTLSNRIEPIIEALKNFNKGWSVLYTSVDAGTRETYKQIRGRDLFEDLKQNLYKYTKAGVFTSIQPKYILLDEEGMYNLGLKDIYGFAKLLLKIYRLNPRATDLVIDRNLRERGTKLSKKMLHATTILTYAAKALNINVHYSPCGFILEEDVILIRKLASKYFWSIKSLEELPYFITLSFIILYTQTKCFVKINKKRLKKLLILNKYL